MNWNTKRNDRNRLSKTLLYNYIVNMIQIHFEWDENKNQVNIKKHKVSFEEAKTVFLDDYGRIISDPDHSEDEERFILLGESELTRLLVVVHCYK